MQHFADERCDAAVVEVGLGGRTDCTNVFDEKPVTVITNIELEHTRAARRDARGDRAREGGHHPRRRDRRDGRHAPRRARRHRSALRASAARTLWRLGREIRARVTCGDERGSTFDLRTPARRSFAALRLPLAGAHQVRERSAGGRGGAGLRSKHRTRIDEEACARGLASVRSADGWRSMQTSPRVILDSAHNPLEARRLAQALRDHELRRGAKAAPRRRNPRRTRIRRRWCGAGAGGRPRRRHAAAARRTRRRPGAHGGAVPARARRRAASPSSRRRTPHSTRRSPTRAPNDVVCVTGSMFLVGALRERWVPEQQILERRSALP